MIEWLSRLLVAVLMAFPFLFFGALGALFSKQLQDRHIESYEKLHRRIPFLRRLDPCQMMRKESSAVIWNRFSGIIGVSVGLLVFFLVLLGR